MPNEQEEFNERSRRYDETSTPKPDPTELTTEALRDAIGSLRTLIDQRITATESLFGAQLMAGTQGGMAMRELLEREGNARWIDYQNSHLALKELFASQIADLREVLNERYATQCVSADTPVLCTDLIWRPAGDLLVGDELIAFEEEADSSLPRIGRRFCRSVVTANSLKRDSLLRVTTTHGSVRCNRDHPFLAKTRREGWRWIRAEDLTMGAKVLSALDVWEQDRSFEAGWLSGFMDGEGCMRFDPNNNGRARISVNQVMGPTADLMMDIFKKRFPYVKVYSQRPSHEDRWKPIVKLQLDRRSDIMRLLGSVRPQRLLINADRVWENFPMRANERGAIVTSVESVGTGMIASLSTSTKTYIAGGFAMHNTKALDAAFLAQQAAVATSFDASEKAMAAALLAAKEAVEKANVATEKRFDGVTEQLGTQNQSMQQLMPRAEAASRLTDLDRRVSEVKSIADKGFTGVDVRHDEKVDSRDSGRASIAIVVAGASVLLTVILTILRVTGH
jgi:hypothetical protein